jgi:hypothetical protein
VAAGALVLGTGTAALGLLVGAGAGAGAGAPEVAGAALAPWLKIFDIKVLKRPINILLVVCG